jgi:hypothetical protein
MDHSDIREILTTKYGNELTDKLIESFNEIVSNFTLEKWKPSELDAGHFVEAARRIIEFEQTGNYTPIGSSLSPFNDRTLTQYENGGGDESIRILIPRTLKAIFNIRNKRGVGHISNISPNKMDSTFIVFSVKWVLAEIFRLNSTLSPDETQKLVDRIAERTIDLIWVESSFTRILDTRLSAKEMILILLYDKSPRTVEEMQDIIEYKNATNFKKIVISLHKERVVEMRSNSSYISPTGIILAEQIINKYRN